MGNKQSYILSRWPWNSDKEVRRKYVEGFLPPEFVAAHTFSFVLHDIMVEVLRSGEEHGIFNTIVKFDDESDKRAFEQSVDVFDWLDSKQKLTERADILRVVVFPAVLSDMLHFVYEALECSRKAKLDVTYALLRKPLQENLFVLESIARDPLQFAEQLAKNPLQLRGTKLGGTEPHARLIRDLLVKMAVADQFDAEYIAQLRYEKCDDGFDPICNLAMHLFTEHRKIRTDALNINFVFSNWDHKTTQWAFLYSRLPYLLAYTREVVENVGGRIAITGPEYLLDLKVRVAAECYSWWESIPEDFRTDELGQFANAQSSWLQSYAESLVSNGDVRPPMWIRAKAKLYQLFRRQ